MLTNKKYKETEFEKELRELHRFASNIREDIILAFAKKLKSFSEEIFFENECLRVVTEGDIDNVVDWLKSEYNIKPTRRDS